MIPCRSARLAVRLLASGPIGRLADAGRASGAISKRRSAAIVTALVTRSACRAADGRPAALQSSPRPACGGRAYHHEKKEHPHDAVYTFGGIAADREESNTADADADGDTLQQPAKVVSFLWRCWLSPAREARVYAGVNFLVDFLKERCHDCVAVLRAKLIVRRGGGAEFLVGQWGVTRAESVTPSRQAWHWPSTPRVMPIRCSRPRG